MRILQAFITNSSSTSFIGWGIRIHDKYLPLNVHDDDVFDFESFSEGNEYVVVTGTSSDQYTYIMAKASHEEEIMTYKYGQTLKFSQKSPERDPQWATDILNFLVEHKIPIPPVDDPEWGWFVHLGSDG